jgi:hypothetical protein
MVRPGAMNIFLHLLVRTYFSKGTMMRPNDLCLKWVRTIYDAIRKMKFTAEMETIRSKIAKIDFIGCSRRCSLSEKWLNNNSEIITPIISTCINKINETLLILRNPLIQNFLLFLFVNNSTGKIAFC